MAAVTSKAWTAPEQNSPYNLGGRKYWPLRKFNALWLKRGREEVLLDLRQAEHYKAACWILRDRQQNLARAASPWLLRSAALIQSIVTHVYAHRPLIITSGFRTPSTNSKCGGVPRSLHLADYRGLFFAMDIRIEGLSAHQLGQIALFARQGGVGIYPHKNFVHIDVGKPRTWIKP